MGNWRNSASLMVLSRISGAAGNRGPCNYDILLQTRTQTATFRNSVVFPGGTSEATDASPEWLKLLQSFGYTQHDFNQLHHAEAPSTPLFQTDPILRHISLRITAIRETFEELGLLICTRVKKGNKTSLWASEFSDLDLKHWQHKVSKSPEEFLNLCTEYRCYPDIWSLHYWSNWLTPSYLKNRFDTAFFITALQNKPANIQASSEVAKVDWANPFDVLSRNRKSEVILYPPQSYELHRLTHWPDIEKLVEFASKGSHLGYPVLYHALVETSDGQALVFPGDDYYPPEVNYNKTSVIKTNKSILELRRDSHTVHRYEIKGSDVNLVLKNHSFNNNMDETVIPVKLTISG